MPLEILISGCEERNSTPLYLSIYDYNVIKEKIDSENTCHLVKKILAGYYGERKVYHNELESLKHEIHHALQHFFQTDTPETTTSFLRRFLERIARALDCGEALILTETGLRHPY